MISWYMALTVMVPIHQAADQRVISTSYRTTCCILFVSYCNYSSENTNSSPTFWNGAFSGDIWFVCVGGLPSCVTRTKLFYEDSYGCKSRDCRVWPFDLTNISNEWQRCFNPSKKDMKVLPLVFCSFFFGVGGACKLRNHRQQTGGNCWPSPRTRKNEVFNQNDFGTGGDRSRVDSEHTFSIEENPLQKTELLEINKPDHLWRVLMDN